MSLAGIYRRRRATGQSGAALLMAMMTVALVATLASAAMWQQWRNVEIEASERNRVQARWILVGALDWALLILREDGRHGGADHLAEPWSIALRESRLSTFLAIDSNNSDLGEDIFLSGQIVDAQSRMNVTNLLVGKEVSASDMRAFGRLFEQLGLDYGELERMVQQLQLALDPAPNAGGVNSVPLRPQHVEQLTWLGLSRESVRRLAPYVSVLPTRTQLNLNTASAEVIAAMIEGLDLTGARRLLAARSRTPFRNLADVTKVLPAVGVLSNSELGVATRYFEVFGQLRMEDGVVSERSLVRRNGLSVSILWRERVAPDVALADRSGG